ncbi:MAG: SAM-dependent chlorinase/fluorinase [Desulfobacterota bacterium]|nr:SAM-dependent chlorinase/fluorinase [Thermodesulfobacteriota bacterium]
MKPSGIITLTTDFGTSDIYVGVMKGVILSIAPQARIVDLTHDIAPQDIAGAGFALAAAFSYFPAGTVHVAVVDPGVGTERRAIIIETYSHFFVGPDNGLFSFVLRGRDVQQVVEITNKEYVLPVRSATFHGRDIFAPAAAYISKGVPAARFGPVVNDPVMMSATEPVVVDRETMRGEIIHIDRFGNLITNIHREMLERFTAGRVFSLNVRKKKIMRLLKNYAAAKENEVFSIIGSTGLLEISINGKSAAERLRARVGDSVTLQVAE